MVAITGIANTVWFVVYIHNQKHAKFQLVKIKCNVFPSKFLALPWILPVGWLMKQLWSEQLVHNLHRNETPLPLHSMSPPHLFTNDYIHSKEKPSHSTSPLISSHQFSRIHSNRCLTLAPDSGLYFGQGRPISISPFPSASWLTAPATVKKLGQLYPSLGKPECKPSSSKFIHSQGTDVSLGGKLVPHAYKQPALGPRFWVIWWWE